MEVTRLSTKGQVVLPKAVRDSHAWRPGIELVIEDAGDGVLLRPAARPAASTLDEVFGCLKPQGKFQAKPKTLAQMEAAVAREIKGRRERGRY
jgi:AbrB family looped-hinge helix DNA binding protein